MQPVAKQWRRVWAQISFMRLILLWASTAAIKGGVIIIKKNIHRGTHTSSKVLCSRVRAGQIRQTDSQHVQPGGASLLDPIQDALCLRRCPVILQSVPDSSVMTDKLVTININSVSSLFYLVLSAAGSSWKHFQFSPLVPLCALKLKCHPIVLATQTEYYPKHHSVSLHVFSAISHPESRVPVLPPLSDLQPRDNKGNLTEGLNAFFPPKVFSSHFASAVFGKVFSLEDKVREAYYMSNSKMPPRLK